MIHLLLSTYNGARYLREQLDSVMAQTYTDWRLFIRDDGSTDDTLRIVKDYARADKRITLLPDSENVGACRSFERLLQQCAGADYYAFCDQDDVWAPDKLECSLARMQQAETTYSGKPIVVHSDLRVVDEQLHEIAPSFWRYSNIRPELQDTHLPYLAISNSVTGGTMLLNEATRRAALPMSEKAYMHDAWIALMTAVHGGYIVPIHRTLVDYRQHGDNALGAVAFSVTKRSWAQRRKDSMRNYTMAYPEVFANRCQFYVWKIIYLLHRMVYSMSGR